MTLTLHYHPLASFCWKPLIALYDTELAFDRVEVNLGDAASRDAFARIWPPLKFPVLVDHVHGRTIAESTTVIDYLDSFGKGPRPMTPTDPDLAWQARMWDRLFDNMLQAPMQRIVADALRPAGQQDAFGVAQARSDIAAAYDFIETRVPEDGFMVSQGFTLADCAAVPALFWSDTIVPLGDGHPRLTAYLDRLKARPSVARTLREAEPYFGYFPLDPKPRI
ncbi:glutathione S-transferase family protein [Rhizobium halophytocola]|uniref:Glutathione S-transferase n=1 Tax=Rhizobium halophytocola TaxID=735519 RepID=A0ABS4E6D9_9HYPH|nr:glutathione S-transferase family protein [Rhizobium halophytocola]MBP1853487.1 glutathione S-transferase [Rhizobium halophytocola]